MNTTPSPSPTSRAAPAANSQREVLAQAAGEHDSQYLIRLVQEDSETAMLELIQRGRDGAEKCLHADNSIFPLPLTVALPRGVEEALARQLVAPELPPGADAEAAARHLLQGLPPPEATGAERGLLDFFFGPKKPSAGAAAPPGDVNEALHREAQTQAGVLSSRHAPGTNGGRLACVWAVNHIHLRATGRRLTGTLGTAVLIEELRAGLGTRVNEADLQPGDLIISPTTGGRTGHVGYVGTGTGAARLVYSNSSDAAEWRQNYTVGSWRTNIAEARNLELAFYRLHTPVAPRALAGLFFPVLGAAPLPAPVRALPATRGSVAVPRAAAAGRSMSLDDELASEPSTPATPAAAPRAGAAQAGERAAAHLAGIYRSLGVTAESMRATRAAAGTRGLFGPSSGHRWLVAEGDSWFDYSYPRPSWSIIGSDVIDGLRDCGHDIENIGSAGATVQDMAWGPDNDSTFDFFNRDDTQLRETVKWVVRRQPRAFLLSGGGNDFAGPGFEAYLNPAGGPQPGMNVAEVERLMQSVIRPAYEHIITVVKQAAADHGIHADLPVFLHGYANAFPDGRGHMPGLGPWLAPGFELRGYAYDPHGPQAAQQLQVRQRILTDILERFRAMLCELAAQFGNVHVADFTTLLRRTQDWQNELHPTNAGFDRVASAFNALIESKLGPLPERTLTAVAPAEQLGDGERLAEAGLIGEFERARASFETGDEEGALGLLLAAEARRADDTSTVNAALAALPTAVQDRDAARWEGLARALAAELRHSSAADAEGTRGGGGGGTSSFAFADLRAGYEQLWSAISLRPERAESIRRATDRMLLGRAEYQALQDDLGVPWHFIGIIHELEGSCRFTTHLHNGDPLNSRTVHVPAGRPPGGHPPFTWRESARDALMMKNYHQAPDWSVAAMLWRWERYNGFGYRRANVNIPSPYLWSFSNHYVRGKYTSDGHYDPNVVSQQVGAAVLLKALMLRGEVPG